MFVSKIMFIFKGSTNHGLEEEDEDSDESEDNVEEYNSNNEEIYNSSYNENNL